MRVLFFMTHGGFARNFESTLRELDARAHDVRVAVDRPTLRADGPLRRLAADLPNVCVGPAPASRPGDWARTGQHLRAGLDFLRFLEPGYRAAEGPRRRAAGHVPSVLVAAARHPRGRAVVARVLRAAERARPPEAAFERFVAGHAPDVVALTPLVELGSPQQEHRAAARACGVPSALCVASWDNLVMRGGIHDAPELVAVWNERQRTEAWELHGVAQGRIAVTGAGAYDHWFDWRPSRTAAELRAQLGLEPERPHLLYVGSSGFIAPDEGAFVREWLEQVRAAPVLRDVSIILRPHPLNPLTEHDLAAVRSAGRVAIQISPGGQAPTDTPARRDYFDAIAHSSAVVGVNTSAFVESAIVGRPTHTVLTARYRAGQSGTLHFRHLLPDAGGVLQVATSWDEHRARLTDAVAGDPSSSADAARRWVRSFVRPQGLERSAAAALVDALQGLAGAPPIPRRRPGSPGGSAIAHATRLALRAHAARAAA